ncbi:ABC transporter ATP-binding protein [Cellulomonas palmilytica]|uniref:ABC transporter ATP-binding protein n=1 Tax=Cellulomonas palmilytica TaxID=2608402 RepID=UPI001F257E6A|nr:ATP-binding cassette domain-containing protein [Cellulomonas palmilytica]UJP40417.1 ATP-binding cassette domain-containing protein [Cellulomonas palmilytica]
MSVLSACDLVARTGSPAELRGAHLEVADGEAVALLGPARSGTTTMLQALAGLVHPVRGRVRLDGRDLASLRPHELAATRLSALGLVFPDDDLLPELTLVQNVELPLLRMGVPGTEARHRAAALLGRLFVGAGADLLPEAVSFGQRQRAAVARALVHRPRVVLAEDPTAGLDSWRALALFGLLVAVARDTGTAVVVATQDPELAQLADRVVELRDGLLVESPTARTYTR